MRATILTTDSTKAQVFVSNASIRRMIGQRFGSFCPFTSIPHGDGMIVFVHENGEFPGGFIRGRA